MNPKLKSTTAAAAGAEPTRDPARVVTASGPVRGTVTDAVRTFQGIPYAAPPVGDLRWKAPQPVADWTSDLDATKPGHACAQPTDQPIGVPGGQEDCLYLNVTTPTTVDGDLPVIVFIHGGSLVYGDGAGYGAEKLAARGKAVVVTINYRLGAFGFLSHPDLDATANLGLQDQQAALEWLRHNASAFGGDRHNITIMGESGGGYSVCAHLYAPGSRGLFDKAIVHSAGCVGSDDAAITLKQAQDNGRALAERADCESDVDACLRAKSTKDLLAASESGHSGYRLVVDGDVLPESPAEALTSGRFSHVPVLYGANRDEESLRVAGAELANGPLTADGYIQQVTDAFGARADRVLAEYPLSSYGSPSEALTAVMTDSQWARPTFAAQTAVAQRNPVYAFEIAGTAPGFQGFPPVSFPLGTGHMSELAYFFDLKLFTPLTSEQEELSDTLIDYWSSFARNGRPHADKAPKWMEFGGDRPFTMRLSREGIGGVDYAAEHHVEFWKRLNG
ncbi:MAG TPA: carboxylesterase family protein [Stackebrandtia sp.]|uniref:carboxylesterase/lipase family protein n=1 Tax=Stackebrandtia sp. TaxID=2023065 RepID=UPI002D549D47|nr:carboxylesterase family protein [Stackebrandtia sp.]HZE38304.1 carboxylesterase family protein [Stackebrandtia sp.]